MENESLEFHHLKETERIFLQWRILYFTNTKSVENISKGVNSTCKAL